MFPDFLYFVYVFNCLGHDCPGASLPPDQRCFFRALPRSRLVINHLNVLRQWKNFVLGVVAWHKPCFANWQKWEGWGQLQTHLSPSCHLGRQNEIPPIQNLILGARRDLEKVILGPETFLLVAVALTPFWTLVRSLKPVRNTIYSDKSPKSFTPTPPPTLRI